MILPENTAVIFDFDSTIIDSESLERLADYALIDNPRRQEIIKDVVNITNQCMRGEISFDVSLSKRLELISLNAHHVAILQNEVMTHISKSFIRNIEYINNNKDQLFVISGGFKEIILPVSQSLGLLDAHVFANEFVFEGENIVGVNTNNPLSQAGGKIAAAKIVAESFPQIVMVGDGYTDYTVKEAGIAELFIAYTEFTARDAVVRVADKIASSFDGVIGLVDQYTKNKGGDSRWKDL